MNKNSSFSVESVNDFLVVSLFARKNRGVGFILNSLLAVLADTKSLKARVELLKDIQSLLSGNSIPANTRLSEIVERGAIEVRARFDGEEFDAVWNLLTYGARFLGGAFTTGQVNNFVALDMHLLSADMEVSATVSEILSDAHDACVNGSFKKHLGDATTRLHIYISGGVVASEEVAALIG